MATIYIDPYSRAALAIEMYFNDTPLSVATAFIWQNNSDYYLVTNWHNVTGRDSKTGKPMSSHGGVPNKIKVLWNGKGKLGSKIGTMIPLLFEDGNPLWLVHPRFGSKVDVIALPITPPPVAEMYPINTMPKIGAAAFQVGPLQNDKTQSRNLKMGVGQDVFILGYPFGIEHSLFPIWKRGSFASEPELIDPSNPCILVDTASRPGMSGSPVIQKMINSWTLEDGSVETGTGASYRFVGIYSGRLSTKDQDDAQLGIVWPVVLLEQIIASRDVVNVNIAINNIPYKLGNQKL